jgi:hypothetical protein
MASFLAALHQQMLAYLKKARDEKSLDWPELLEHWHQLMEMQEKREDRKSFFSKVVAKAKLVSCHSWILS